MRNRDLIEDILSLLEFLRERGIPVDRSTGPEARQLLAEAEARFPEGSVQAAYEAMRFMDKIPGGFLIYCAGGEERIVYANQGLLRIFRCDNWDQFQALTRGSFRGMVHPEDLDAVEESIRRQIAESQYDLDYVEYRILRRDGTLGWIEDYGHFVRGETDFFYVFLGDATEKLGHRLQEEREQKRILTEALHNANLSIAARDEFLTNMSHNLRTPMNTIFGVVALAKSRTADPLLLDYLKRMESAGRQLMDMLEKALEVSGAGEEDTEEVCDLCRVAEEVCGCFQPQARKKGLALVLDCVQAGPGLVQANRERLRRVMTQLVGNAVAYTGPEGQVSVTLAGGRTVSDGRRVYALTVEDTGVGISPAFLPHVFEPFARERNTTQSGVNGMGLGLTIVKSVVDRMGGAVQVDSTPGKGSVFTVTLPLREAVQPSGGPAEAASWPRVAGHSILLVEDNEFNRELETEILRGGGFVVDTAENGRVAVEKVKRSAPGDYDLILMDIQMPEMDGWQASRLIRNLDDPDKANIPILALSANTLVRDMRRSLESGMDAHLPKPINVPQLLEEIGRAVDKKTVDKRGVDV